MTPEERFVFDLQGYLIIKQVLSPHELASLNELADRWRPPLSTELKHDRVFRASAWGPPYHALIDHPTVVGYLVELVGPHFRLDHDFCIYTLKGGTGDALHGGEGSDDRPDHWYMYRDGVIRTGLTVVTYCLTSAREGDGGFCCVPGSHKSNFNDAIPGDVRNYLRQPPYVVQPAVEAGDVIVTTEALIHGTAPWKARHERRALLYKYSPGNSAWMNEYYNADEYEGITEQQRRILAPPSVGGRLIGERPASLG